MKWYFDCVCVDAFNVMVFDVEFPFEFINIIFNFRSNEDNKSSSDQLSSCSHTASANGLWGDQLLHQRN